MAWIRAVRINDVKVVATSRGVNADEWSLGHFDQVLAPSKVETSFQMNEFVKR